MLSPKVVEVATNLAEAFVRNNTKLVAKQGTLLAELNNSIKNATFGDIGSKEYLKEIILSSSKGTFKEHNKEKSYMASTHDAIMDNYIRDLIELVSNHVGFTRSVVNKEVKAFKEALEKALTDYKFRDPEDFFNVIYYKLPNVLRSDIITSEIEIYKDKENQPYYERLNLERLRQDSEFNLKAYLLIGDNEVDSEISNFLAYLTENKLQHFIFDDVKEFELSTPELIHYSFVNYLFYRNLAEKTDLNIGLSEVQLRIKASHNRDYFGKLLSYALTKYYKDIRNGVLLTSDSELDFSYYNNDPVTITIYEESFEKLAEEGGSIEVLFGFITSTPKHDVTVSELLKDQERYINNWNNVRNLYFIYINNRKLDTFKLVLSMVFNDSLNRLTDAEKEVMASNSAYLEETKQKFNDYLENLTLEAIEDLEKICLDIVAGIRFRFSSSYYILNEMKSILSLSDDIKVEEAALYATIHYLTDFFIEQVEVVKI